MSHTDVFEEDTYMDLEGDWVIHRYRNRSGKWYAGARHRHIDDLRCNETNSTDSVYAHLNWLGEDASFCMVCKERVPDRVLGMQELVQYANRQENGE